MTNKQIIARRAELESQLNNVLKSYYKVGADEARAKNESQSSQAALTQGRIEMAKGILAVDIRGPAEEARAAQERLAEVKTQGDVIYRTRGEMEWQLDTFLARHFSLFAEQAEKRTEEVREAFDLALRAIAEADRRWGHAVMAWAPLCRAAKIPGVPPFPLGRAEPIAARPPSVRVEDVAA
jgi:hypothetical protein